MHSQLEPSASATSTFWPSSRRWLPAGVFATLFITAACTLIHTPARRDPFVGLGRPAPSSFKTLKVALAFSENTKQLLELLRKNQAIAVEHGVTPDPEAAGSFERSVERFGSHFASVTRIDEPAQARGLDVDLVVVWDSFVTMTGVLSQKIEIEQGAIFLAVDGTQIEHLRASAKREMSLSESKTASLDAQREVEARFEDALRGSAKLITFAEGRAPGAAPPAAVASAALRVPSRMVVVPLRAACGVRSEVCGLLTNYMLSLLDRVGGLQTVGQADVDAMLGLEKQKDILGCTSTACAAEIGGALGADLFLYGEVGKVGSSYAINMTIVRTATSSVGTRVSRMTPQDEDSLRAEIPAMVAELVNGLNDSR